jgi:thiol-disulfide isomerase/thioredoxin
LSDTTSPPRRRPSTKTLYIGAGSLAAVLAIVVVSIFTGAKVTNGNGDEPTSALVGKSVATFSLSGLQRGNVEAPWKSHHSAVLIFFASTCPPCQGEMPKVAKYLRNHNEGSIRVLGVDANDLSRAAAERFVKKDGVTFPIAWDPNDAVTTGIFKFATIPETAFVNAKGIVKQIYFGAIPKDVLIRGIAALRA